MQDELTSIGSKGGEVPNRKFRNLAKRVERDEQTKRDELSLTEVMAEEEPKLNLRRLPWPAAWGRKIASLARWRRR